MPFNSQNLNLPYIAPAQAQKHVTHNEALRALDAVVQLSLVSKSQTTPPMTPIEGNRYFVAANGTAEWAGKDALIAAYQDGAWAFYAPQSGWQAWIEDESILQIWDGTIWQAPTPTPSHQNMTYVGINTTADTTNRLSVSSLATLFTHAGNGHQLKLNKNAAGDTVSVLYQSNWSGRAEIGLTGDDDFHFKVSPDGGIWNDAITLDKDTGNAMLSGQLGIGISPVGANDITIYGGTGTSGASIQMINGNSGSNPTDGFWFGWSDKAYFWNYENTATQFATNNISRMSIEANGDLVVNENVGIGIAAPTTKLDVDGPIRPKTYTTAALPSAVSNGAGAIIYVSDETGGAVLAFSDGTNWRRVTDRAVAS